MAIVESGPVVMHPVLSQLAKGLPPEQREQAEACLKSADAFTQIAQAICRGDASAVAISRKLHAALDAATQAG